MSHFKKFRLLFILILIVVSCTDETTVFENPQDTIGVELNSETLLNSVVFDDSGVLDIFEEDINTGKFAKFANEQAGDYPLTLVAKIEPPLFSGGENLTATDVHIDGDFAYVSYNTAGAVYAGAVDIVNIGDPTNPFLAGRAYSYDKDLNAIHYDNGYAYIVGGIDAEQSVLATDNSVIIKVAVNSGRFNTSDLTYNYQAGFNATDIELMGNSLFVTSGKDGFISEYSTSTLELIKEAPFTDLRSLSINNDKIAVLDASVGVRILNTDFSELSQISITSDFRESDKRTLDFSGDKVVVSEGENGAGVYNASTGSFIEYVPILINPDDVSTSDVVTNAVAFNEDVLLMANGGAGLCLSEENNSVELVGIIELEGSINYVATKGDFIFAASGREGLQIIKMNKPSTSLQERCSISPRYFGSSILNVPQGDDLAYSGSRRLREVTVDGSLLLCGSWTVRDGISINNNAILELSGIYTVARNNRRRNVTISEGATLRLEGEENGGLTIWGDLILEDNATLEFLGNNNAITVHGDVIISDSATVIGNYDDTENKF
ncbi:hypothetical protein MTsPCn9_05890 [Croceitalea sp. MTPC9]|uniref:hypothetical protein n=1 Tax=unclassified Croceitalea TaxID=2632280 RepID=UPI002B3B2B1A|nr:hypothetical protein MTsPCn6_02820 [Croceitalea sp. MTPC6]GMN15653.1 hypothetical protein MTsPCn9_05890 [Croceitalea sp. MTPC9]